MKKSRNLTASIAVSLFSVCVFASLSGCTPGQAEQATSRAQSADIHLPGGVESRNTPQLPVEPVIVRSGGLASSNTSAVIAGQVEARHVVTVSSEVAARIEARPVERGDSVTAGQIIALLDTDQQSAQRDAARASLQQAVAARRQLETEYARTSVETDAALRQAKAQVASAEAGADKSESYTRVQELRQMQAALAQAHSDEDLAKIENERYERLVAEGAVAQQALDRTRAALKSASARVRSAEEAVSLAREGARSEDKRSANAQVEIARAARQQADTRKLRLAAMRRQIESLSAQEAQAQAALRQAEIQLAKHRILAPFSGRVLETLRDRGDLAAPGTPILRLADIRTVKSVFAIPEASRGALRVGQVIDVNADGLSGAVFRGRIVSLGFEANRSDRAFPAEVLIENPSEKLLPGMVTRIALPVAPGTKSTTVSARIPIESVTSDGGESIVYVLKEGTARRRVVTLGEPVGSDVEVRAGLTAGESIARTPQRLTDGAAVRIPENP